MEETQKAGLCEQLRTIDTSLVFVALLLLATGLSWKATAIQRQGLCDILLGKGTDVPDVFSIRLVVSAIVIGALTFFFGLSLDTWRETRDQDQTARRSADMNVWASLFVLAAALIRLCDLVYVQARQPVLEAEIFPE